MKAILAATIVIHYLGLAVVTDQFPNERGVQIIVPRVKVSSGHPLTATHRVASGARPAQHQPATHVEDHMQILIVRAAEKREAVGWEAQPLPGYPAYVYFELDGDYVRFDTKGATNPEPSMASLPLPRLQWCGRRRGGFRPEYRAPYSGAAAVFDLKEGTLTACKLKQNDPNSRYDSELELNHNGSLVIDASSRKKTKRIVLPRLTSRSIVIVANVPTCMVKDCLAMAEDAAGSLPHFHALYAMVEGNTPDCEQSLLKASGAGECKMLSLAGFARNQNQPSPDDFPPVLAMTFECSNTQWP